MFRSLCKPWYVYQPSRLLTRLVSSLSKPLPGYCWLRTSWGGRVLADPSKTIGRAIVTTGIYDLAVSEAIARLAERGDTVIDAGANVGYMTQLAAVVVGTTGRVVSYEPHPELFEILRKNSQCTSVDNRASPELHAAALGSEAGTAYLSIPAGFGDNDGLAQIAEVPTANTIPVGVETVDGAIGTGSVAVMKLDVEGFEYEVLKGAAKTIGQGRLKHIIFEEHHSVNSSVVAHLQENGYRIYALGWYLHGLRVEPIEQGVLATDYEAPNFIATLSPVELLTKCENPGWKVLRNI